jgi:G3E family GTPase
MSAFADHRIPVTILTGFLGAGKTTLLNHLIQSNPNEKIIVIENEFGEVAIDQDLVMKVDDSIFTLSDGCICCNLNLELLDVLGQVSEIEGITHLIIETTGVADPGPVILAFLEDEQVQFKFQLNAVIALADVGRIERQLETIPEAGKQIALADVIVLSKGDVAEAYTRDTARNIISRMNPLALVVDGKLGDTGSTNLLELHAFRADKLQEQVDAIEHKQKSIRLLSGQLKEATSMHASPLVAKNVMPSHLALQSFSFRLEEELDFLIFRTWINLQLTLFGSRIYRVKGILYFKDMDGAFVFQSVQDQYVLQPAAKSPSEPGVSRLVFIGHHLDEDILGKGLVQCTAKPIE